MTHDSSSESTQPPNDDRTRRRNRQAGVTLVELLVVLATIGLLANIAIPIYLQVLWKARATAITNDFLVVREAVLRHHLDHGFHPREYGRGREPNELRPYLEGKVNWKNLVHEYDWDYWVDATGAPTRPNTGVRIGFTVFSRSRNLRQQLIEVYGGPVRVQGNRMTFIIEPV